MKSQAGISQPLFHRVEIWLHMRVSMVLSIRNLSFGLRVQNIQRSISQKIQLYAALPEEIGITQKFSR